MSEFLEPLILPVVEGLGEAVVEAVVEGVGEGVAEGFVEGATEAVAEASVERFVIEDETAASVEERNLASRLSNGLLQWDAGGLSGLFRTDEARRLVEQVTQTAVERAKAGTPVRTGAHRDAIFGTVVDGPDGKPVGVVGSTHPTWHLVEFGSINQAPSRSITNGVEQAGVELQLEGPGTTVELPTTE